MNFQHHKEVKIKYTVLTVYDLLISKQAKVPPSLSEAPHFDHFSLINTLHLILS